MTVEEKLLPAMTEAFTKLSNEENISTSDFVAACDSVVPMFDHIGTVFIIAKHEFVTKRDSLAAVSESLPFLKDVVEAGKADGTITKKNSPARNLHRLLNSISFMSALFVNLGKDMTLRESVSAAYDATLALIHAWVVRAGIKAGLVALPNRSSFLLGIGETDESAREHLVPFTTAADGIVSRVEHLFDGITIPKSDISVSSLWK